MECTICHKEFELPEVKDCTGKEIKTDICGTCAQILMDEEEAYRQQEEFERNREAYEEEERARHFDNGGGWRYC